MLISHDFQLFVNSGNKNNLKIHNYFSSSSFGEKKRERKSQDLEAAGKTSCSGTNPSWERDESPADHWGKKSEATRTRRTSYSRCFEET